MLQDSIYEQVINKALDSELSKYTDKLSQTAPIDNAEASVILSKYLTGVIEKGLDNIADNGGDISSQIDLANKLVSIIKAAGYFCLCENIKPIHSATRRHIPSLVLQTMLSVQAQSP